MGIAGFDEFKLPINTYKHIELKPGAYNFSLSEFITHPFIENTKTIELESGKKYFIKVTMGATAQESYVPLHGMFGIHIDHERVPIKLEDKVIALNDLIKLSELE